MAAQCPLLGVRHGVVAAVMAAASCLIPDSAPASPAGDDTPSGETAMPEPVVDADPTSNRPTVELDRLEFPAGVPYAKFLQQHLRRALAREARKADWGAGAGARIEYRVKVTELQLTHRDGVLRVDCTMRGQLPRGKSAISRLSYGGSPSQTRAVMAQVLEIVARGVVTRLAELERERRSQYNVSERDSRTVEPAPSG